MVTWEEQPYCAGTMAPSSKDAPLVGVSMFICGSWGGGGGVPT